MDFIQWCKEDGVQVVTAYAFSTVRQRNTTLPFCTVPSSRYTLEVTNRRVAQENWNRDPAEVGTLMGIFAQYAQRFRTEALAHDVKVNVLTTG